MIRHHPEDDLLLAQASGSITRGAALLVAVHLESCAQCRERVRALEAAGGALLAAAEPQLLAPDALAKTLARIDEPQPVLRAPEHDFPAPTLPDGARWPRALRTCSMSRWRWMAPGMRFASVEPPVKGEGSLYLLQIAPGKSLARHTHSQLELTQVLCGSFDDGRSSFAAGDFDAADGDVLHQPVVAPGATCVCLAYVEGKLKFEGRIAAAIGSLIGM